ncbi:hypothetical protein CFP56_035611 [Quercus suber]|uniref:Uncharacterized protein n=1 Tax=Quercus suber TaxID=58331 RepID=A0AAW0J9S4_QUESU
MINIIIRATVTRWHNLHEVEAFDWYQQTTITRAGEFKWWSFRWCY